MRSPSNPQHAADTLHLRAQLEVVAGPHARARRTNGGVLLHVRATTGEFATCDPMLGDVQACMTAGEEAFQTVYSARLK